MFFTQRFKVEIRIKLRTNAGGIDQHVNCWQVVCNAGDTRSMRVSSDTRRKHLKTKTQFSQRIDKTCRPTLSRVVQNNDYTRIMS